MVGRQVSLKSDGAAMRLADRAGESEAGGAVDWARDLVLDWFSQRSVR